MSKLKTLKELLEINGVDFETGDWTQPGDTLIDLRKNVIDWIKTFERNLSEPPVYWIRRFEKDLDPIGKTNFKSNEEMWIVSKILTLYHIFSLEENDFQ